MSTNPKVSVCVVTYNHEKYIRQCLESIVTQECDFDFEVIVGEDCSTDETRAIVKEYAKKHPNIIKPIYHKENVGGEKNLFAVHDMAKGKYIASMDGDDYWHQGKLSYQVKLFDSDSDLVQVWHCADVVDSNSNTIGLFPSKIAQKLYPKHIGSKDIVLSYALVGQRSTQMFKASAFDLSLLPPGFLDFHIAFLISLHGKSYYSKKVLGAYRYVQNNSLTTNSSSKRITVDLLSNDLRIISDAYPDYRNEAKANIIMRRFISKIKKHDLKEMDKNIQRMKSIKTNFMLVLKSFYYFILQKI